MTLRAEGEMDKSILDKILLKNQAQPVGDGYIDIIINPDNTYNFITEIKKSGFILEGVSWWEYCLEGIAEAKFGMGGPKSIFYNGYLAEIPINDIDHFEDNVSVDFIESFLGNKVITNKQIGVINYSQDRLWPGFWIHTPVDWKNDWPRIQKYAKIFKSVTKVINSWDPIGLISMGAPDNEYDIEIRDFLPELLDGKEKAIFESFNGYFGDTFKATIEDTTRIEATIKSIIKEEY